MSALVDRAIAEAGLDVVAEARREGAMERVGALAQLLEGAALLAIGALADRIRAEEVGDVVRVYANVAPEGGADVVEVKRAVAPAASAGACGTATLRRIAIARITGPRAARVRIDWEETGLELAQVALGFGASELVGPLANRRGLPIAGDARRKVKGAGLVSVQALKRKELEALLVRAGRTPLFVEGGRAGRTNADGLEDEERAAAAGAGAEASHA